MGVGANDTVGRRLIEGSWLVEGLKLVVGAWLIEGT